MPPFNASSAEPFELVSRRRRVAEAVGGYVEGQDGEASLGELEGLDG